MDRVVICERLLEMGDVMVDRTGDYYMAHILFYGRVESFEDTGVEGKVSNMLSDSLSVENDNDANWYRLLMVARIKGYVCEWKCMKDSKKEKTMEELELMIEKILRVFEDASNVEEIWNSSKECVIEYLRTLIGNVPEEGLAVRLFEYYLNFPFSVERLQEMEEYIHEMESSGGNNLNLFKVIKLVYGLENNIKEFKIEEFKNLEKFKTVKFVEEDEEIRKLFERCFAIQSLMEKELNNSKDIFTACLLYLRKERKTFMEEIMNILENVREGYSSVNFYLMRYKSLKMVEGQSIVLQPFELNEYEKIKKEVKQDRNVVSSTIMMIEENNFERRVKFSDEKRIENIQEFYKDCLKKKIKPNLLEKLFNECFKQSNQKIELIVEFIEYVEIFHLNFDYSLLVSDLYFKFNNLLIKNNQLDYLYKLYGKNRQRKILLLINLFQEFNDVVYLKQAFKMITKRPDNLEKKCDSFLIDRMDLNKIKLKINQCPVETYYIMLHSSEKSPLTIKSNDYMGTGIFIPLHCENFIISGLAVNKDYNIGVSFYGVDFEYIGKATCKFHNSSLLSDEFLVYKLYECKGIDDIELNLSVKQFGVNYFLNLLGVNNEDDYFENNKMNDLNKIVNSMCVNIFLDYVCKMENVWMLFVAYKLNSNMGIIKRILLIMNESRIAEEEKFHVYLFKLHEILYRDKIHLDYEYLCLFVNLSYILINKDSGAIKMSQEIILNSYNVKRQGLITGSINALLEFSNRKTLTVVERTRRIENEQAIFHVIKSTTESDSSFGNKINAVELFYEYLSIKQVELENDKVKNPEIEIESAGSVKDLIVCLINKGPLESFKELSKIKVHPRFLELSTRLAEEALKQKDHLAVKEIVESTLEWLEIRNHSTLNPWTVGEDEELQRNSFYARKKRRINKIRNYRKLKSKSENDVDVEVEEHSIKNIKSVSEDCKENTSRVSRNSSVDHQHRHSQGHGHNNVHRVEHNHSNVEHNHSNDIKDKISSLIDKAHKIEDFEENEKEKEDLTEKKEIAKRTLRKLLPELWTRRRFRKQLRQMIKEEESFKSRLLYCYATSKLELLKRENDCKSDFNNMNYTLIVNGNDKILNFVTQCDSGNLQNEDSHLIFHLLNQSLVLAERSNQFQFIRKILIQFVAILRDFKDSMNSLSKYVETCCKFIFTNKVFMNLISKDNFPIETIFKSKSLNGIAEDCIERELILEFGFYSICLLKLDNKMQTAELVKTLMESELKISLQINNKGIEIQSVNSSTEKSFYYFNLAQSTFSSNKKKSLIYFSKAFDCCSGIVNSIQKFINHKIEINSNQFKNFNDLFIAIFSILKISHGYSRSIQICNDLIYLAIHLLLMLNKETRNNPLNKSSSLNSLSFTGSEYLFHWKQALNVLVLNNDHQNVLFVSNYLYGLSKKLLIDPKESKFNLLRAHLNLNQLDKMIDLLNENDYELQGFELRNKMFKLENNSILNLCEKLDEPELVDLLYEIVLRNNPNKKQALTILNSSVNEKIKVKCLIVIENYSEALSLALNALPNSSHSDYFYFAKLIMEISLIYSPLLSQPINDIFVFQDLSILQVFDWKFNTLVNQPFVYENELNAFIQFSQQLIKRYRFDPSNNSITHKANKLSNSLKVIKQSLVKQLESSIKDQKSFENQLKVLLLLTATIKQDTETLTMSKYKENANIISQKFLSGSELVEFNLYEKLLDPSLVHISPTMQSIILSHFTEIAETITDQTFLYSFPFENALFICYKNGNVTCRISIRMQDQIHVEWDGNLIATKENPNLDFDLLKDLLSQSNCYNERIPEFLTDLVAQLQSIK
ncbi:hypothetical protein ROZALSC1DRAFT_27483 [Rozella allomycis CSF55]|uniref:Uncharacterized protein n=1 Tax=Rozella allomycis (strain CSF55) TaxID=988480 RepID=A0A4P9YNC0_ROZAC|nr:hypothetical protein ROZALSC1DRAFT_27483 [Rozella allomycis CSF55]